MVAVAMGDEQLSVSGEEGLVESAKMGQPLGENAELAGEDVQGVDPDLEAMDSADYEAAAFDAKVLGAIDLLQANPLNRMMLYRILRACDSRMWPLHELEEHVLAQPEYTNATQPPYFLISWLVEYQALDAIEIDHEGAVVTQAMKEGLSEDEVDDLVADFAFTTNDVGRVVLEEFAPSSRLVPLIESVPERYDTYVEVLEFLREKRSYQEIDQLLRGREVLMTGRSEGDRPMQPSVFIDKLAQAGSISFKDGWMITEEGKEMLETIQKERNA